MMNRRPNTGAFVWLALLAIPMTSSAAEYESAPVLEAAAVLPSELLKGPHYRVDDKVDNDGYLIDDLPPQLTKACAEYAIRAAICMVLAPDAPIPIRCNLTHDASMFGFGPEHQYPGNAFGIGGNCCLRCI